MCPFCIATAAWIAAGVVSTGGVAAFGLTTLLSRNAAEEIRPTTESKEVRNEHHSDRN